MRSCHKNAAQSITPHSILTRTTLATLAVLGLAAALPQAVRAQTLLLENGDVVLVDSNGTSGKIGGYAVSNGTTTYNDSNVGSTSGSTSGSISGSTSSSYAVRTDGDSKFTLGDGGTLIDTKGTVALYAGGSGAVTINGGTLTSNGSGMEVNGTGPVTITGGSFTGGGYGYGLESVGTGATPGLTAITGGSFTGGTGGSGLFAGGGGAVTINGGSFTGGTGGYALFAGLGGAITLTGGSFTAGTGGYDLFANTGTFDLYGSFTGLKPGDIQTLPTDPTNGHFETFFGTLENDTVGQTFTYDNYGTITLHDVGAAPEPSEWAALGFTAFGMGGLLLRARKRLA